MKRQKNMFQMKEQTKSPGEKKKIQKQRKAIYLIQSSKQ